MPLSDGRDHLTLLKPTVVRSLMKYDDDEFGDQRSLAPIKQLLYDAAAFLALLGSSPTLQAA